MFCLQSVAEALAADSNLGTDILSQALSNCGLMPAGEEGTQLLKERLVNAVSQAFSSMESAEDTEHGTRVILSDSASGLKKSLHTVRKVGIVISFYELFSLSLCSSGVGLESDCDF